MTDNHYEVRIENDLLPEGPEERLRAAKLKLHSYLEEWRHRFAHEAPSEVYTSSEGRTEITSPSLQKVSVKQTMPNGVLMAYEYDAASDLPPSIARHEPANDTVNQQPAGWQPDPMQAYEALSWILFTASRTEAEGR